MPSQEFPQGIAHLTDEIIGLNIGNAPVSARPLAFPVFSNEVFLKGNEEHDHRSGGGQKIAGQEVFTKSNLGKDIEPLVNRARNENGFPPPAACLQPVPFSINQWFDELSQNINGDVVAHKMIALLFQRKS